MTAATDELRARLDVPADLVPDASLDAFLDVSAVAIFPYLVIDADTLYPANVAEAELQLAVKMWDVSTRGAVSVDALGDWMAPAASATPGMIRSVFGTLGPALATGGITV